tara:strand:+ start:571 stop:783 length:213 start_codon:yes stop_codon:yes gene_type:complete
MLKYLLLKLISFYKAFLSPYLGGNCKYEPSCSNYSHEAISKHGAFKGGTLTILRLVKCNPFSRGGYDPIN